MDYNFLTVFFVLSIVNVIFATIKSLVTINGDKLTASLISGGYFAFYNIMMQYTVADFPMWQKCLITFICNVVGVYLVKWGEEKSRKDKLWKIEATFDKKYLDVIHRTANVKHSYIDIGSHVIFNFYAENQCQSTIVKGIVEEYNGKYFVSESKTL